MNFELVRKTLVRSAFKEAAYFFLILKSQIHFGVRFIKIEEKKNRNLVTLLFKFINKNKPKNFASSKKNYTLNVTLY